MENVLLKLTNPRVFKAEFERNISKYSTHVKAYEAVEDKYKSIFGERKYSCYNSFRNSTRNMPSISIW